MRTGLGTCLALAVAAGCSSPQGGGLSAVASPETPAAASATGAPIVSPPPAAPAPAAPLPAAPPPAALIGAPVPAFVAEAELLAVGAGQKQRLDSRKAGQPVVYAALGTGCPASRAYVERSLALERAYAGKARFVYLYPNVDEPTEQKRAYHRQHGFTGGFVDDRGGRLAKLLAMQRTSELVITDRAQKIAYRGPIDDARNPTQVKERHAVAALDSLLAGNAVARSYADVFA